ncbi:MAG: HU family DNA-binding protein [Crocinitomicaceae bacterium]
MTKADLIAKISEETGLEKNEVSSTVESMMGFIKKSLSSGQNVYLRGFGCFVVLETNKKTGLNISKNTAIIIPAHNVPSFKPAKVFVEQVKNKVKVK